MGTVRFESRGRFRAPPSALWPFLADTPKLNRAVGLPPIHYTITPADGGGSDVAAEVRLAGRTVARWTEHPFGWREPYGYAVTREFHGGPFVAMTFGIELTPIDGGSDLLAFIDFVPRNLAGAAILRTGFGQRGLQKIVEQCRLFEQHLEGELADPFPQLVPRASLPRSARALADRLVAEGADAELVERLYDHLETGRDDEVAKMRPFELADRWEADRRAVLALFLRATVAGLVTMSWDVLCPNCRTGQEEHSTLRDLRTQAHCEYCNVVFDASFDRLIEVRFNPAPAIRPVEELQFCIGGPMNTPHVIAQVPLGPGDSQRLVWQLPQAEYRLRSAQAGTTTLRASEDAERRELTVLLTPDGIGLSDGAVASGEVDVTVENRTEHPTVLAVEGDVWASTVATAAAVSTMQEFRDLFSSEALAPGLELGIRRLAFVFTDLAGSTAMYQRVGQARAFRFVQDHFRVLTEAIASHRGAVVKTIGDAVMATFETGPDALAAAVAIQRGIRDLNGDPDLDTARVVKIGVHQGPCVAVTLNDRLDYFGTTVNIAARTGHEARGGEIVATVDVADSDESRAILTEAAATISPDTVHLRGIAEPIQVCRIAVP